jgi:hypothetical protein
VPSRFAQEMAARSPLLNTHFGERTRIEPQRRGEFTRVGADPDKPPYEAVGVWQPKAQNVQMRHALGSSSADNVQIAVDYDHVSYLKSVLGDEARWPRAGWGIVRVNEPGQPVFEVAHAAADGVAWWRCRVLPV